MHKVQRTVLIVDDAQADRVIIQRALRQDTTINYHLLEAENGAQALAYLWQQQPDCLLLGCELPDTDGVTLLQTVVQQAAPHLYPVVMLAGASSTALAVAAMQQGAHDFLSKAALSAEQVQRAVNNAIEKVALLCQLEEQRAWSQLTLASISDAVIATDTEGCVTYVNPVAETLTGWTADAAQGQPLEQVFRTLDEATHRPVANPVAQVLRTQQRVGQANHTLLVQRDGHPIPINHSAAPIHDRLDNLSGVLLTFHDLSARKAAERQLAFHASLLDHAYDAIVATDAEQNIIAWNRGAEEMYGWSVAEVLGHKAFAVTRSSLAPEMRTAALQQMNESGRFQVEVTTYHRDGTPILVEGHTVAMRDTTGQITGYMSISRDIGDRKRVEAALRTSEERFRILSNAMPQLVWTADAQGRVDYYNRRIEDYDPATRLATGGFDWSRFVHPDDLAPTFAAWQTAVEQGEPYTFEHRLRMADHSWRWHLSLAMPMQMGDSQVKWYGTATDIHERKQIEEALRTSEAQLNAILYNIPVAVYILTTDHRYLLVNRIYEQENNISNAEIHGQSVYDRWSPQIAAAWVANEQQVLTTKATVSIEEAVPRDGEMRIYATIKAPLLNAAGEPYAIIGISTDITERKRAEEALRRREEQLRAIINAVPGLVAYVDQDERYQFVNATYSQWFVRPLEEIEGHTLQELSGAELYQQGRHRLAQVLAGQEVKTEATFTYPDGVTRTLLVNYIPHLDAAGQPQGFYVVDTDISERKQAEALLRQQAELLDQAHDAIIVWELGGVIRYWNRGAEAMYGWTNAEALGQVTHQLLQTQHPMARAEFEQMLRDIGQWMGEVRHITRNGRQLVVESRYMVTRQDDGVYLVLESNRDMTERNAAAAQLRQSEERYRTLFETMDEGFCVLEMIFDAAGRPIDYRFLEANPTFARFTGLEDAVGKTARQLVPNLEAHWFEMYGNVARSGEPYRFVEGSAAMGRWFEVYAFRFGGPESRQVALLFNNITERKQAEDQLRSQEELLRQIADNVPGLIAYIGADERYRFVNATFETWFQRTRQQIIGSTVRELIGDDERARLSHYRQQALAGESVTYETLFTYPDGVTRTVWGRYQPHIAVDGTVPGFYLFIMDITERKQAEEQVRASEARFRQLANAMPQVVWTCDATGAITYINNQWSDYSGMSFAQTLEQGMWPALHPDDQGLNRTQWQQAVESGQAYEAELRLRRADGEYRWHLERALPIRNDAGVIEQWFGASFDIDDHKRVQDALAQANQRFVLAENASNGWVYDFDVQQWTAERSAGFSRILGYAPEEISPDVAWWHSLFHPEDRPLVANQTPSTRDDAEFTEVEYRIRHRDGHYVHVLDRSRNIHNATGQRVRVVGITVDISERKRAEHALQQFNEQLEQQVKERTAELTKRLRELDQFAYVASHDLKAPLRALDHLAQWISNDAAKLLPATSLGHLDKMRGRILRMDKLLDDLLAYSRADRYQYTLSRVDVALLLDDIVRLVTPPQGFAVNAQTPLPVLITQKVPLETVLRNLINNAIKHHDRSDGQVQLAVQDLGQFLEFSVSDDGPGIEPEFHERIFQIFQTLKPRDQVEGSGMGLAIVKKIIESRNGRITVISTPGQGATFRFTWPKE